VLFARVPRLLENDGRCYAYIILAHPSHLSSKCQPTIHGARLDSKVQRAETLFNDGQRSIFFEQMVLMPFLPVIVSAPQKQYWFQPPRKCVHMGAAKARAMKAGSGASTSRTRSKLITFMGGRSGNDRLTLTRRLRS